MVERKKSSRGPKFTKISEEMQQWSALLAGEVSQWPKVAVKSMFGMTTFYRSAAIFGAVPATRALTSPNSVIFKLVKPSPDLLLRMERDGRVGASFGVKQKWNTFELSSPQDLRDAIAWFSEAYEAVQPLQKVRVNQKRKQSGRNTRR